MEITGFHFISDIYNKENVSEILINGHNEIYIEENGELKLTDSKFPNEEILKRFAFSISNEIGRKIDSVSPFLDGRLKDGSRVNIVIPPLSINGTTITIRKFVAKNLNVDDFIANNTFTKNDFEFILKCILEKRNVIIAGGTGSGKTTILNILGSQIPGSQRLITIEDSSELKIKHPHVITLESRPANTEGIGKITIRDLLKNSLRMRPDRIIVGECRGEEVLDMLQAFNTGHPGSFTTIHANTPREALFRLELMIGLADSNIAPHTAKMMIASTKAVIIQMERTGSGLRRISEISEISGLDANQILLRKIK